MSGRRRRRPRGRDELRFQMARNEKNPSHWVPAFAGMAKNNFA